MSGVVVRPLTLYEVLDLPVISLYDRRVDVVQIKVSVVETRAIACPEEDHAEIRVENLQETEHGFRVWSCPQSRQIGRSHPVEQRASEQYETASSA